MQIEWTGMALDDMAALDKGIARRVKLAVERFAETGAGKRRAKGEGDSLIEAVDPIVQMGRLLRPLG